MEPASPRRTRSKVAPEPNSLDAESALRSRGGRRVLLVTFDAIGPLRGGSALRVLGLARALAAAGHSPTVAAAVVAPGLPAPSFEVAAFDATRASATLASLVERAEVIVLPPHGLVRLPFLDAAGVSALVFDLYDPLVFALIESHLPAASSERRREIAEHTAILNQALRRGDFFLCASERQRDFWLGALAANGRLANRPPASLARDLIDVVPFGLSDSLPAARPAGRAALCALAPAVRTAGTVVVWGGGLRDWLDPCAPVRALARLAERRPDVHLVVFAGPHPTSGQIGTEASARTRELVAELGIGSRVHFVDEYVPYEDFVRALAESDAAVSTHRNHLEARFAFRTRIIDGLGAGLPIICTAGDVLAEFVGEHRLGIVVPEDSVAALADAIEKIAADADFVAGCRRRIEAIRPSLSWERAAAPLARFCAAPRKRSEDADRSSSGRALFRAAWRVLLAQGPREALRRVRGFFFVRS